MANENMFEVVKRGYDQEQVLEYVEKLETTIKKQKMGYEAKLKQMEAQVEKNRKYAENADKISELVLDAEIRADKILAEAKKKAEELLRKAVESAKATEKDNAVKKEQAEEEVRQIIKEGRDRANRLMEAKLAERLEEKKEIEKQIQAQKEIGDKTYAEICNKVYAAYKVMNQLTEKVEHANADIEVITRTLPEQLQSVMARQNVEKEEKQEQQKQPQETAEAAEPDAETKVINTEEVQKKLQDAAQ